MTYIRELDTGANLLFQNPRVGDPDRDAGASELCTRARSGLAASQFLDRKELTLEPHDQTSPSRDVVQPVHAGDESGEHATLAPRPGKIRRNGHVR